MNCLKKNTHGFSIMFSLLATLVLSLVAVAMLLYRDVIEKSNRKLVLIQTINSAEETLQSQLAVITAEVSNITELKNVASSLKNLSIPILGTSCGNAPCVIYTASVTWTPVNAPTTVTFTLKIRGGDKIPPEFKSFKDRTLSLPIKNVTQNLDADYSSDDFVCRSPALPVFQGITKSGSRYTVNCTAIGAQSDYNIHASTIALNITCKSEEGFWMKKISANLQPVCEKFEDTRAPASEVHNHQDPFSGNDEASLLNLCKEESSLPLEYKLSSNLEVEYPNTRCQKQKDIYEFMEEQLNVNKK